MWSYSLSALAPAAVKVYYRAVGDITKQWTPSSGTDNFALVNEVTANDTNYVYATANAKIDEYLLEPIQQPPANTDLIIKIRLKTNNAISVKIAVYTGTTLIQESTALTSSEESYQTTNVTVPYTTWSTSSINWGNLRLRITSIL
jgi:hypothetical protein